jgi:hypothetical protein
MPRSRTNKPFAAYLVLGGSLLALLLIGLRIVGRQMETGNAYPEYSTFRTDPKGLKAFYDAVGETTRIGVSRLTTSTNRESSGQDKVLFVAGLNPQSEFGSEEEAHILNGMLTSGGRLVIALNTDPNERVPSTPQTSEESNRLSWEAFIRRWGTIMSRLWMPQPFHAVSSEFGEFPRWFGSRFFDKLDPAWRVIVWAPTNRKEPVVVERHVGAGSVVLLSDSFPLSNESLSGERNTAFLLWLLGDKRQATFSEIQLGINQKPGIMTLANRYGLQGLMIGLVIAFLLFVWKSQYSLIPRSRTGPLDIVAGRSAEEAFVALLRRAITEKNLLSACVEAWKRTAKTPSDQLKTLETILSMRSGTPVQQYAEIDSILKRKP